MYTKFLLIVLSVVVFSSCSTAYKSGQTPDDVYYSPVRPENEKQDNKQDEDKTNADDVSIRMGTRDRRWRDLDNDDDYRNSPYHYCTCNCNNYGYYYNPYYYPGPVYNKTITRVNTTPRMVNLKAYTGFENKTTTDPKTGNTGKTRRVFNNSNGNSGFGSAIRQIFSGGNSSSSNNNRSYSPSSGNNSGSGSSKSGSVSRPKRGE